MIIKCWSTIGELFPHRKKEKEPVLSYACESLDFGARCKQYDFRLGDGRGRACMCGTIVLKTGSVGLVPW